MVENGPLPPRRLPAVAVLVALVAGGCASGTSEPGAGSFGVGATGPPAGVEAPELRRYVSLGDSYSAGGGLLGAEAPCGRAPGAYPRLVAQRALVSGSFHACNGATTADVLERERHPGEGRQIDRVLADADVVTVSIGGNDIGFGPIITDCVIGPRSCVRFDAQVTAALAALAPRLSRLYAGVRSRAPGAEVIVVGYPRLVASPDAAGAPGCAGLTAEEARWVREKGEDLDRVARVAAESAGVRFLDAASAFAGHEACTAEPWMSGVSLGAAEGSFHPNSAGHEQLARLVVEALRR